MENCKHNKVKMKLVVWAESSSGCDFEAPKHAHRQGLKESLCCADCGVEVDGLHYYEGYYTAKCEALPNYDAMSKDERKEWVDAKVDYECASNGI